MPRGSAGSAISSSPTVRGGIRRISVRYRLAASAKSHVEKAASRTAPFREPAERFDEGFLGHFLGATAVVAKAVSHIDERTLPAANDLLECGEISLQYAINGSLVVRRAHDLPDMSTVRLPPCSIGCVLFST